DPLHPPSQYVADDPEAAFAALDYPDTKFDSETSWRGGTRFEWDCPQPRAMTGLEAAPSDTNVLARLRGFCGDALPTQWWGGKAAVAPTSMLCPPGTVMIGIHGQSSRFVDALGPVCAALIDNKPDSDHPILSPVTGGK